MAATAVAQGLPHWLKERGTSPFDVAASQDYLVFHVCHLSCQPS